MSYPPREFDTHSVMVGHRLGLYWAKVDRSAGCWLWTASVDVGGYGRFYPVRGQSVAAHRISYELANGPIPHGMLVDHMCHNRACVNPDHLQVVSQKLNSENRTGAERGSKSGVRGVYWHRKKNLWAAQVRSYGRNHHAGYFRSLDDAEQAVIAKRNALFTNNLLDKQPHEPKPPAEAVFSCPEGDDDDDD